MSHACTLRRDRVILAMIAWTLLAAVLFVALWEQAGWPVRMFWAFQPPLDALLALSAWRVHRLATGSIRRFWLVMALVGGLFTLGDSYQAVLSFVDPRHTSTTGGTVQTACFAVGLAAVVLAMLIHPHPNRTGRERLAFWLDSATLLIGGAVLSWCFAGDPDNPDIVGILIVAGVSVAGTFAAVKMILSGNAPMHKIAALPMLVSAAAMAVGVLLAPATDTALGPLVYLVRFTPSLLIAIGPRIQEVLAHQQREPFGGRRRKPYSLLPYGSMAVALGTLIVILPQGVNARLWGVVAGLVLICALVAARQLVAFHDNSALIQQLREHEAQLRHQAMNDGLTGLANRTCFHERTAEALATDGPVSLLIIDLDGFKNVNDTMGHAAGDALLAAVADKLRATVRDQDLAARLGGDEFAVLLPAVAAEAEQTAQRLLTAFREPVPINGVPVPVNASIGVAAAAPGADVESLLHDADLAMYAAKGGGKGTWMRFEPHMATSRAA